MTLQIARRKIKYGLEHALRPQEQEEDQSLDVLPKKNLKNKYINKG